MARLVTSSNKPLPGLALIPLPLMFGVVYGGLGLSYLGFADPDADPLALGFVLLMAIFGWLVFLILLVSRWKKVRTLSFPSHVLITLAIGVVSSVFTWPLFVVIMYSEMSIVRSSILCGFAAAFVPLVFYAAYAVAMRSLDTNPPGTN